MNIVKQFQEKRQRGRPRNPTVDRVNALYPPGATRRTSWNRVYGGRGLGHLFAVLGEGFRARIRAGDKAPLPWVVLYALGTIPPGPFARRLTRECLRRRRGKQRAHDLAAWVRGQQLEAAIKLVEAEERKKNRKK